VLTLFVNELSQDDYYLTKPDPRYLEQICIKAKIKANECIMIGDRIDKDIIPAIQNKMGTVFVKTGVYKNQRPRTVDEIPDLVIENINGLGESIKERFA
jgi:ribonucleotide monophosphatase NagD (HAD superfamily)